MPSSSLVALGLNLLRGGDTAHTGNGEEDSQESRRNAAGQSSHVNTLMMVQHPTVASAVNPRTNAALRQSNEP